MGSWTHTEVRAVEPPEPLLGTRRTSLRTPFSSRGATSQGSHGEVALRIRLTPRADPQTCVGSRPSRAAMDAVLATQAPRPPEHRGTASRGARVRVGDDSRGRRQVRGAEIRRILRPSIIARLLLIRWLCSSSSGSVGGFRQRSSFLRMFTPPTSPMPFSHSKPSEALNAAQSRVTDGTPCLQEPRGARHCRARDGGGVAHRDRGG
jgi:hypothetical protein